MNPNLPLSESTAARLTHRYRKPGEWVGDLTDGRKIYIVATAFELRVVTASNITEALTGIKNGEFLRVRHNHFNSEVPTEQMLAVTGLKVKGKVQERIAGELT